MTFTKNVAGLVPGFMALGLVGSSVQMVPKDWGPKGVKKKKPGEMIGGFTELMIGMPMLGQVSSQVSAL